MIKGLQLTLLFAITALAFYTMNFYLMSRYDSQRRQKRKSWGWKYTLQLSVMAVLVILQPLVWPALAWHTDAPAGALIQAAGGFLVLIAFGLHIWSRLHLGRFYVERVEVQPDHELIDSGPYGWMRHPIITSFLCLAAGLFLINPAVTTALVLVYTIWDFTGSASREEQLLSRTVPGYKGYMDRVPRYLPRVGRHR